MAHGDGLPHLRGILMNVVANSLLFLLAAYAVFGLISPTTVMGFRSYPGEIRGLRVVRSTSRRVGRGGHAPVY